MDRERTSRSRSNHRGRHMFHSSLPAKLNKVGIPERYVPEDEYTYTSPLIEEGPVYYQPQQKNSRDDSRRRASSVSKHSHSHSSQPHRHSVDVMGGQVKTQDQVVAYVLQPDGTMAAVRWDDKSALDDNYSVLSALQEEQRANRVGKSTGRIQNVSNPSARLPADVLNWLTNEENNNKNKQPPTSLPQKLQPMKQRTTVNKPTFTTQLLVSTGPNKYTLVTSPRPNHTIPPQPKSQQRVQKSPDLSPNYYHTLTSLNEQELSASSQHAREDKPSNRGVSIAPSHSPLKQQPLSTVPNHRSAFVNGNRKSCPEDDSSQVESNNSISMTFRTYSMPPQANGHVPKPPLGRTMTAPAASSQRRHSDVTDFPPDRPLTATVAAGRSYEPPSQPVRPPLRSQQPQLFYSPSNQGEPVPAPSRRHSLGPQASRHVRFGNHILSPNRFTAKSTNEISVWDYFRNYDHHCATTDF